MATVDPCMETLCHSIGQVLGKVIDLVVRVEFRWKVKKVININDKFKVHTTHDRSARGKIGYLCVGHRAFWVFSADLSRVLVNFPTSGAKFRDIEVMEKDDLVSGVFIRTNQKFPEPPFPSSTCIQAKKTPQDKQMCKGKRSVCVLVCLCFSSWPSLCYVMC